MLRLILLTSVLIGANFCSIAGAVEGPKPCAVIKPEPSAIALKTEKKEEANETIKKPKNIIPLGCDRPFGYRGQIYSADTPQSQDASNLKSFIQTVPESNDLMEQYQSNRNKSKISAYTGTVGLFIFALSGIFANRLEQNSQQAIRSALSIGGLSLAAGGFIYSFALLRTNEYLIPKAVDAYNVVKPNDPVELQFSASWGF